MTAFFFQNLPVGFIFSEPYNDGSERQVFWKKTSPEEATVVVRGEAELLINYGRTWLWAGGEEVFPINDLNYIFLS